MEEELLLRLYNDDDGSQLSIIKRSSEDREDDSPEFPLRISINGETLYIDDSEAERIVISLLKYLATKKD